MPRLLLLAAAVAALAMPAHAGEQLIGRIVVSDGGTATNRTTNWAAYTCARFTEASGGCFEYSGKITIQTDEGCYVGTDRAGCDAGTCMKLAVDEKLPTSCSTPKNLTGKAFNSDAGTAGHEVTYYGCWVAVSPPIGGATCNAKIFSRTGTE